MTGEKTSDRSTPAEVAARLAGELAAELLTEGVNGFAEPGVFLCGYRVMGELGLRDSIATTIATALAPVLAAAEERGRRELIGAAQRLAVFARTAPGRLPQAVQDALLVVDGTPPAGPAEGGATQTTEAAAALPLCPHGVQLSCIECDPNVEEPDAEEPPAPAAPATATCDAYEYIGDDPNTGATYDRGCVLAEGHDGQHRDDDGEQWSPVATPAAPCPGCGAVPGIVHGVACRVAAAPPPETRTPIVDPERVRSHCLTCKREYSGPAGGPCPTCPAPPMAAEAGEGEPASLWLVIDRWSEPSHPCWSRATAEAAAKAAGPQPCQVREYVPAALLAAARSEAQGDALRADQRWRDMHDALLARDAEVERLRDEVADKQRTCTELAGYLAEVSRHLGWDYAGDRGWSPGACAEQTAKELARLRAGLGSTRADLMAERSALAARVARAERERDDAIKLRGAWEQQGSEAAFTARGEARQERDAARAQLAALRERVGAVLSEAGCSCDCGHDSEGHDDDCYRCLACRVEMAMDAALDAASTTAGGAP